MKKYNYFYYGQPIPKSQFISEVPNWWKEEVIDGEYSFGGFRAIEIEND
jgi:hypothetical protein